MKHLKSLYEGVILFLKFPWKGSSAYIRTEKQLKAVRGLIKEYDWKNKTPVEVIGEDF